MNKSKAIEVVKQVEREVPAEVFEGAIVEIGKAMRAIANTRVTRGAVQASLNRHLAGSERFYES